MKALDLFCGGGGAARGLVAAGFDVCGVDLDPRCGRAYPGHFIVADACSPPVRLADFDMVWASPPCQRFSSHVVSMGSGSRHPNLIPAVRALLAGHPFTVIENVPMAPIRPDVVLTGPMVGLWKLRRRRHFEQSFPLLTPPVEFPRGRVADGTLVTVLRKAGIGSTVRSQRKARGLPGHFTKREMAVAMGLSPDTAMSRGQIGEAIPPRYAALIARHVADALRSV